MGWFQQKQVRNVQMNVFFSQWQQTFWFFYNAWLQLQYLVAVSDPSIWSQARLLGGVQFISLLMTEQSDSQTADCRGMGHLVEIGAVLAACYLSFLADRSLSRCFFLCCSLCSAPVLVSPARSVPGLLFPVHNVDIALLQVVFQVVIWVTMGTRSIWGLAHLPYILLCYVLLLKADR